MTITLTNTDFLENLVADEAAQLAIDPDLWRYFIGKLEVLKKHHVGMYAHSLRVGWYACGLAAAQNLPKSQIRLALYGGCGHDIGKSKVPNRFLNTKRMTSYKFSKIQPHAEIGYELLKDEFLMTAFIAGLHHNVRPKGYGIDLDTKVPDWATEPMKDGVYEIARLVCLADFFDALTTRRNDKGLLTESEMDDPAAIKRVTTEYFLDNQESIDWLVANRFEQLS